MNDLSAIRKAVSSIPISNAKRNIIIKAFSEGGGVTPEEFALVKDDVKTLIDTALTKSNLGKANGVASLDSTGNVPKSQLGNIDTDLFYVVTDLPTTDIKNNKIYLKQSTKTGEENIYTEYAYINNAWEKMGEFKADPDLSGYAKLNGNGQTIAATYLKECRLYDGEWYLTPTADNLKSSTKYFATNGTIQSLEKYARLDAENTFTQDVYINRSKSLNSAKLLHCIVSGNGQEPYLKNNDNPDANYVYNCAGGLTNINEGETFTFTLDDGSTVEKKIRIIN